MHRGRLSPEALLLALALIFAVFATAMFLFSLPAKSQAIEIGPGGVYVNPLPDYGRSRNWARTCEELRIACEYKSERGEEGHGNCRRYRERCE
jgi:hypothetical protein